MNNRSKPKYRFQWLLVFALLMVTLPFRSVSASEGLEYVYPDQSVWTTQHDDKGLLKNPLLLLAKQMFTQANIDWYATPYPAKRMFKRLKEGTSNFSILVQASSLKECCIFSKKPVTFTELRVYRRNGLPPINNYQELSAKKVAAILGYSYGNIGRFIRDKANNVTLSSPRTHRSAFSMLKKGHVDYVLDYRDPSEEMIADIPVKNVSHDVLIQLNVYLVLNKNYPGAQQLMNKLESIVDTLDVEQILSK